MTQSALAVDTGYIAPQQGKQIDSTVRYKGFQAGVSGNPAGRPTGSRNKLTEAFLVDCLQSWHEHGKVALQELRERHVETYCKIMASLIPKQSAHVRVNANTSRPLDSINAELIQAVQALGYTVQPVIEGQSVDIPHTSEIPTDPLLTGNTGNDDKDMAESPSILGDNDLTDPILGTSTEGDSNG